MIAIPALLRNWKLVASALALAALGMFILSVKLENAGLRNKVQQRNAQIASIVASYKLAESENKQAAQANLVRVARQQEAINDRIETANLAATDYWRGRFERVRAESNRRAPDNAGMSTGGQAPGGADGPDHDPGRFVAAGMIAVKLDDLETLVIGAQRGRDLQEWAKAQGEVATVPEDATK